jgi:hypothetical protein
VNLKQASKRVAYIAGALHEQGLQVFSVRVLPELAIRVDKKPPKVDTWAYVHPPRGCVPSPVECVALVSGVRVTWYEKI